MIQLFTSHQTWEMLCSAVPLMVGGSGEASQITRFHCFYFDKVLGKKAKKNQICKFMYLASAVHSPHP